MPDSTATDRRRRRRRRPGPRAETAPAGYDPSRYTDERLAAILGLTLTREQVASLAGRVGVDVPGRLSRVPTDDLIVAIAERLASEPASFPPLAGVLDRASQALSRALTDLTPDRYADWLAERAGSREALGQAMWALLRHGGEAGGDAVDAQIGSLIAAHGAPATPPVAPAPQDREDRLSALERAVRELREAVQTIGDRLEEREFRIASELRLIREMLGPSSRGDGTGGKPTAARPAPARASVAADAGETKPKRRRRRRRKAAAD